MLQKNASNKRFKKKLQKMIQLQKMLQNNASKNASKKSVWYTPRACKDDANKTPISIIHVR